MKKVLKIISACGIGIVMIITVSGMVFAKTHTAAGIKSADVPERITDRICGRGNTDEPGNITDSVYGWEGMFDPEEAQDTSLNYATGEHVLKDMQITGREVPVIQNEGDSVVIVRNCCILGETEEETVPLAGAPGSLLIAGTMRTTLAMQSSRGYYINSTIISRNWAVLSTDAAQPAGEGEPEPGVYAYGSEAIALEGGYGVYADIFCKAAVFGSFLQSPEIGIISGSYGKVVLGNIADGEADPILYSVLSEEDKEKRQDKELETVVKAGRNALMIHSLNLPYYWHFNGYSKEELPFLSAEVDIRDSVLETDLSLEQDIAYDRQQKAYIDHTKGSVILIKSTNVEMQLEESELIPAKDGTGYLIQTVYNNDTLYMIAVPDGQSLPGIHVKMKNMSLEGDISHEDYQRDFYLELADTEYTGAMNQHGFEEWQEAAQSEGFADYCPDTEYHTQHGLHVSLTENAVWNVTGDSNLTDLEYEEGCRINGQIYLDGVLQSGSERSWHGEVTVRPF